jgi:hypothetical protein
MGSSMVGDRGSEAIGLFYSFGKPINIGLYSGPEKPAVDTLSDSIACSSRIWASASLSSAGSQPLALAASTIASLVADRLKTQSYLFCP